MRVTAISLDVAESLRLSRHSQRAVPDLHDAPRSAACVISVFLKSGLLITINIASHELDKAAVSEIVLHLFVSLSVDRVG